MNDKTEMIEIKHGSRTIRVETLIGDRTAPPLSADHAVWYMRKAFRNDRGIPLFIQPEWKGTIEAIFDPSIWLVLISTPRQQGKTQITISCARYKLIHKDNLNISTVSNAKDQVSKFIRQKIKIPLIHESPLLRQLIKVQGRHVLVPSRNSVMEVLPTKEASSVGSSSDEALFEEAKAIPDPLFSELWPSVIARPDFKLIILSVPGVECGFFYDLVTMQQNDPDPSWHLFYTEEMFNPMTDREKVRRLSRAGSRAAEERNLYGRFASEGDAFLSRENIDRAVDKELTQQEESKAGACWAFLDTSSTKHLTSLLVVRRPNFEKRDLELVRISYWKPSPAQGLIINMDAVKAEIEHVIKHFSPEVLEVDCTSGHGTEILAWAAREGYSQVVAHRATMQSNQDAWGNLRRALNDRFLRIPKHERLLNELYGLKTESFNRGMNWRVVDPDNRLHRELTFSLARAVYHGVEAWGEGEAEVLDLVDLWEKTA